MGPKTSMRARLRKLLILAATCGLIVGYLIGVTDSASAAVKPLPSYSRYTDWYRDRTPTLNTPIRYGVTGRTITTHTPGTTTIGGPRAVTTVSTLNGRQYAVRTFTLDKTLHAAWTTRYPYRGQWTVRRMDTVRYTTCITSPYWWIDPTCFTTGYSETVGTDTFTIK